jgi:tRNA nucleotidyltransferase (CCA-adding enzyme)
LIAIFTHEYADFDALASLVAAHRLYPQARAVRPAHLSPNVARFVTYFSRTLTLVPWADIRGKALDRIILTDTRRIPHFRGLNAEGVPITVFDHHPAYATEHPYAELIHGQTGAVTTLLVERMIADGITLSPIESTLMVLGIYEDTGSLTYRVTTSRDARAVAWLLDQGAVLDTVREYLSVPLDDAQQELLEQLGQQVELREVHGHLIAICTARSEQYLPNISGVVAHLRSTLDVETILVLVQMPGTLQLVCRTRSDAVHVGQLASAFGGGGHARAAAAKIHGHSLQSAVEAIHAYLLREVPPVDRVRDIMSRGLNFVAPDDRIADILPRLQRVGHEGYPVVQAGRVVGLLNQRDAGRAAQHHLADAVVADLMQRGAIHVQESDPVSVIDQVMASTGWGQIPVQDDAGRLTGIVTRTDLIRYWAARHAPSPAQLPEAPSEARLRDVMGAPIAQLITGIATFAQNHGHTLYLVAGFVRDLILARPNRDIDFVVEDDAIAFANALAATFGGRVHSYAPFRTAKWFLGEATLDEMGIPDVAALHCDTIDFATARNEFYEHPTALPSVYSGSIKLDLHRRDFTINTLAVQLSPRATMWRLLDFYGGLADLNAGLIRVLHSLSFIDDPTRILRAVRFSERLGFAIEPDTAALIANACPMLGRITGERVRNELALLLHEAHPSRGLRKLDALGALAGIHPGFRVSARLSETLPKARDPQIPWALEEPIEAIALKWHVVFAHVPAGEVVAIARRLLFSDREARSFALAAELVQHVAPDLAALERPREVYLRLQPANEVVLVAAYLAGDSATQDAVRLFANDLRHRRIHTNGETLRQMGIAPGPAYRRLLKALHMARLDGEITTADDEKTLLASWLASDSEHLDYI